MSKNKDWRNSRIYRIWKITVIRRDRVCQVCGSRKKRQAHHINSARYFPHLRFIADNGICLCYSCHFHFYHILFKGGTKKKTTKEDFVKFMEIAKHYIEVGKGLKGESKGNI